MLTVVLAHAGRPLAPHDLWSAWEPIALLVLLAAGAVLWGPTRRAGEPGRRRARSLVAALVVLAVALGSPLDALSGSLASAHMVQHLLLVLVAAPLLVRAEPGAPLLRAAPTALARSVARWGRRPPVQAATRSLGRPAVAWSVHVGVLWFWHAAGPYDAALEHEALHLLEHASFLATAVLVWHAVLGRRAPSRHEPVVGILLVFGMAVQSVFLSLLLTFAESPWYAGYADTTQAWGLSPLDDQRLAGVLMWVPAGAIHVLVALALVVRWVRATDGLGPATVLPRRP